MLHTDFTLLTSIIAYNSDFYRVRDRILYTSSDIAPCLMSSDGRVLISCTDNYEIVVWDLAMNTKLCTLQGHTAPIAYVAMSSDRNFIASYSIDRTIKIWGVSESLRDL